LSQIPVVSVVKQNENPAVIPSLKSVVIARVTKVNPRFASVLILCVDEKVLSEPFQGIIRVTDVRQTQVDQVNMYDCFRPGDIVRAEVISLGTSRSYFLSTARNEYGVIYAKSVVGATMIPISWNLMQCPKTKITEPRKVAKPLS
jgi:exosome complex component CSL4